MALCVLCSVLGQVVDKQTETEQRTAMGEAAALRACAATVINRYVTIFLLEFDSVNMACS